MSIDYTANFGIGYKVTESEEICKTKELEDGLLDYLWSESGGKFEGFENGNYMSGISTGIYLVINDAFENGPDLTKAKSEIDAEIKRLKLITDGEFGLVGGMLVS